jgi:peptide/nickel transport system ATP-binding protein
MYLGRIVEIGRTRDIIQNPAHPYTRALLSAVPEADPYVTKKKEPMKLRSDNIPSLNDIPAGCAFHPRCPFYVPGTCDTIVPPLSSIAQFGQMVACEPLRLRGELKLYET